MITGIAPAKINLFLRVCGKTNTGYHQLDSVIAFTDFGDKLTITMGAQAGTMGAQAGAQDQLYIRGPFAAMLAPQQDISQPASHLQNDNADNLVMRAIAAFRAAGGRLGPVEIILEKHIPVGAGLGGGSADAAAALRLVNKCADRPLDAKTLSDIAAGLGADVPVCLGSYSARVAGIGTECTPYHVKRVPVLLVNPRHPLSTAAVFGQYKAVPSGDAGNLTSTDPAALLAYGNDLLAPACQLVPEITTILGQLRAAPGCIAATMSGSGASCLGIFTSPDQAAAAAAALRDVGYWTMPTSIKSGD
jgi:4-diphosphocytidyl-2-C-methyl-D-erythritol kinase